MQGHTLAEGVERVAQRRLQGPVDLHHVKVRHPLGQVLRQHAKSPAHLKHHVRDVELSRATDHLENVVVHEEVLTELSVRPDAELAHPPPAGLTPAAHQSPPKTRAAFRSTASSSASYDIPRSSATNPAVATTLAGSLGLPRTGCGAR